MKYVTITMLCLLEILLIGCNQSKSQEVPQNEATMSVRARRIDYLIEADSLMRNNEYKGAAAILDRSIKMDSSVENMKAFLFRGRCRFQLKQYEAAVSDATYVIERDPYKESAFFDRAIANIELSKKTGHLDTTVCHDLKVEHPATVEGAQKLREEYCK